MIKKGRSLRKESYLCERSAVSIFWLRRNVLLKVTVRDIIWAIQWNAIKSSWTPILLADASSSHTLSPYDNHISTCHNK